MNPSDLGWDNTTCVADPDTCGPDAVCEPLLGMRCNGTVLVPPGTAGCPPSTHADGEQCALESPGRCSHETDCPHGSYCDYEAGGTCRFDCLPPLPGETCTGPLCCTGNTYCDCLGRCVTPDDEPWSPPSRLPELQFQPGSVAFARVAGSSPTPRPTELELIGLAEVQGPARPASVEVIAGYGTKLVCASPGSGTVPGPTTQWSQRCSVSISPDALTRKVVVWLLPNEADGTPVDAPALATSIEARVVVGVQRVVAKLPVSISEPSWAEAPPVLIGRYEGQIRQVWDGELPPNPTLPLPTGYVAPAGVPGTPPIDVVANVTVANVSIPAYGGFAVDVSFDSSQPGLFAGSFPVRFLNDVETTGGSTTCGVVDPDGPATVRRQMNTMCPPDGTQCAQSCRTLVQSAVKAQHRILWDACAQVLHGDFGVRNEIRDIDHQLLGVHGYRFTFELRRVADELTDPIDPDTLSQPECEGQSYPNYQTVAPSPMPAFDAATFAALVERAEVGSVASCWPGMRSRSPFDIVCAAVMADAAEAFDTTVEAFCPALESEIVATHFTGPASPFDEEILTELFVPCYVGGTGPGQCPAHCSLDFRTTVATPNGDDVAFALCRFDGAHLDPRQGAPTAWEDWRAARGRQCADRFEVADTETPFEPLSRLTISPVPDADAELSLHDDSGTLYPRRTTEGYSASRRANASVPLRSMLEACAADARDYLDALDADVQPASLAELEGRVAQFLGGTCFSPGRLMARLKWLSEGAADAEAGRLLLHDVERFARVMTQLVSASILAAYERGGESSVAGGLEALEPDELIALMSPFLADRTIIALRELPEEITAHPDYRTKHGFAVTKGGAFGHAAAALAVLRVALAKLVELLNGQAMEVPAAPGAVTTQGPQGLLTAYAMLMEQLVIMEHVVTSSELIGGIYVLLPHRDPV